MTALSSLSIITINANSLNTPNKSKRLSNWIKKSRTQLYATYKNPTIKIRIGLKLKNKKKTCPANTNQKKAGVATLISKQTLGQEIPPGIQKGALYNDQQVNSPRRHIFLKCVCI